MVWIGSGMLIDLHHIINTYNVDLPYGTPARHDSTTLKVPQCIPVIRASSNIMMAPFRIASEQLFVFQQSDGPKLIVGVSGDGPPTYECPIVKSKDNSLLIELKHLKYISHLIESLTWDLIQLLGDTTILYIHANRLQNER